jgi:hypothetical protein
MYLLKQAPPNVALVVIKYIIKGIMMSNYEIEICDNVRKILIGVWIKGFFMKFGRGSRGFGRLNPLRPLYSQNKKRWWDFTKKFCKLKVVEFFVEVTSLQHELEEAQDLM